MAPMDELLVNVPPTETWRERYEREQQEKRWAADSQAWAPVHQPEPYAGQPPAATPIEMAREAVLHHRGVDVLAGRWRMSPCQATPAPWSMVSVVGTGADRTICRVSADDLGRAHVGVCMTVGKHEIEEANAELIARMRYREPIIAAECIRLAEENERLRRGR